MGCLVITALFNPVPAGQYLFLSLHVFALHPQAGSLFLSAMINSVFLTHSTACMLLQDEAGEKAMASCLGTSNRKQQSTLC